MLHAGRGTSLCLALKKRCVCVWCLQAVVGTHALAIITHLLPALRVTMCLPAGATVDVTLPERFAAAAPPNTTVSLVSTAALQAVGLQVAAVVNSTLAVDADGRVNRSTGVQAWLDGLYTGCNPGQVRRAAMVLGGTC
jgi:hypothetical protein